MDSEIVPIWLIFNKRPLQACFSMAVLIRKGLVTVKSEGKRNQSSQLICSYRSHAPSPTTWDLPEVVNLLHDSQSSWSKGSSIETMGYLAIKSW